MVSNRHGIILVVTSLIWRRRSVRLVTVDHRRVISFVISRLSRVRLSLGDDSLFVCVCFVLHFSRIRICKVDEARAVVALRSNWKNSSCQGLRPAKADKFRVYVIKVIDSSGGARPQLTDGSFFAQFCDKGELVDYIWRVLCGDLFDVVGCLIHDNICAVAFHLTDGYWVFKFGAIGVFGKS